MYRKMQPRECRSSTSPCVSCREIFWKLGGKSLEKSGKVCEPHESTDRLGLSVAIIYSEPFNLTAQVFQSFGSLTGGKRRRLLFARMLLHICLQVPRNIFLFSSKNIFALSERKTNASPSEISSCPDVLASLKYEFENSNACSSELPTSHHGSRNSECFLTDKLGPV